MKRAFLYGAALALTLGFAAQAQDAPQTAPDATPAAPASEPAAPPTAATPPANPDPTAKGPADASSDVSATVAFKAGQAVTDASGGAVGKIARVGKTADGTDAVEVDIDGKKVSLPASALSMSPTGNGVVSSMTKADILAAQAAATPK